MEPHCPECDEETRSVFPSLKGKGAEAPSVYPSWFTGLRIKAFIAQQDKELA